MLRELLKGIELNAEDLFFLEPFQIKNLPGRVLKKEFSALLRVYPYIQRFLILKYPLIENFINTILEENSAVSDKNLIDEYCQELLWEIADLIVYNKYPEIYDDKVEFTWSIDRIISTDLLKGKVVADVGAGSGMLAFLLAKYAKTTYAIEPISSFRNFIREKANKEKQNNIYAIDGFLDSIPLTNNFIDVLMTSNAIGWNLEKELEEIERVVKPNGHAIHLMRTSGKEAENPFHDILISPKWNYSFEQHEENNRLKLKYHKTIYK